MIIKLLKIRKNSCWLVILIMKIAITGAHSYTGRYVAQRVLNKGLNIVNLTNHSNRSWKIQSDKIQDFPLTFNREHLVKTLQGCHTLVQTYWVRFDNTLNMTRDQVTQNSKFLIDCAKEAGVQKIIYTSHTQTSLDSPFDYIREKAKVEKHLKESGLKYGIVRPCGIFGRTPEESIMINNIAYLIRRVPFFPMPGNGDYIFQFVHADDMADLIFKSIESDGNEDVDAVGPDRISFKQIITETAKILNTTCIPVTGVHKKITTALSLPFNWMFDDILVDTNDLDLMTTGLTCSHAPPTGTRSLLKWIEENKKDIGKNWTSSIKRYYK